MELTGIRNASTTLVRSQPPAPCSTTTNATTSARMIRGRGNRVDRGKRTVSTRAAILTRKTIPIANHIRRGAEAITARYNRITGTTPATSQGTALRQNPMAACPSPGVRRLKRADANRRGLPVVTSVNVPGASGVLTSPLCSSFSKASRILIQKRSPHRPAKQTADAWLETGVDKDARQGVILRRLAVDGFQQQ